MLHNQLTVLPSIQGGYCSENLLYMIDLEQPFN